MQIKIKTISTKLNKAILRGLESCQTEETASLGHIRSWFW